MAVNVLKKVGRLPAEYQEVEYIESSGTQYIDCGFAPSNNTNIEMKYQYSSIDMESSQFRVFGSRGTGSTDRAFLIGMDNNYWYINYNDTSNSRLGITWGNVDTNIHIVKNIGSAFYFDGVNVITFATGTFTSPYNAILFGGNSRGDIIVSKSRVYYCKVYNSSELIRDFVPCYRKSDNVIGLYDTVTQTFFTNAGTGTFLKGNDVVPYAIEKVKMNVLVGGSRLPSGYQEVEYIESSGTQYIDTGFVPNQDTRVVLDFNVTREADNCIFGARVSANASSFVFLKLPTGDHNFRSDYDSSQKNINGNINQWHHLDKNKNVTLFNDVIYTADYQDFSANVSLTVFARNQYQSAMSAFAYCQISNIQIYDNGTLVRNFVPCYSKSDSVVGMYDLANSGKNLFDTGTITKNYRLDPTTGGNIALSGFAISDKISVEPNKTYTISTYNDAGTNVASSGFRVIIYNSNNQVLSVPVDTQTRLGTRSAWTFTIPSNGAYIKFSYRMGSNTQNPANNDYNIQFEEGTTATTYEPYPFYTNAGTGTFIKGSDVNSRVAQPVKAIVLKKLLPNEYQQVEYVESSGTQYIDLGIKPTNTTTLELKFQADGTTNGKIFGSRASAYDSAFAIYLNTSNEMTLNFGDNYYVPIPTEGYNKAINTITSSISGDSMSINVANESYSDTYQNSMTRANDFSLLLFAYRNGSTILSAGKKKIWYLRLFSSGDMIINLVPCYRKSDGVVGMYDLVGKSFYTNAGTGTFAKGADTTQYEIIKI